MQVKLWPFVWSLTWELPQRYWSSSYLLWCHIICVVVLSSSSQMVTSQKARAALEPGRMWAHVKNAVAYLKQLMISILFPDSEACHERVFPSFPHSWEEDPLGSLFWSFLRRTSLFALGGAMYTWYWGREFCYLLGSVQLDRGSIWFLTFFKNFIANAHLDNAEQINATTSVEEMWLDQSQGTIVLLYASGEHSQCTIQLW